MSNTDDELNVYRARVRGHDAEVARLVLANPRSAEATRYEVGGTLLHSYAGAGNSEMVGVLLRAGVDVNKVAAIDGETALVSAAQAGAPKVLALLLASGATFDLSAPSRNALFGSVIGCSAEVTKLLIDAGIDTSVRYNTKAMKNMDALAFAMMRGATDCARVIALHIANSNEAEVSRLMDEALEVARLNVR
jgi:ankyrin repeat protein